MKPNSCVFRAVKKVIKHQFDIDISSEVFDKYNKDGKGIDTFIMADVMEEALAPYGIQVKNIIASKVEGHATIEGVKTCGKYFACVDKLIFNAPIDEPMVLLLKEEDHVEAFTGSEFFGPVKMGISFCKEQLKLVGTINSAKRTTN